MSQSIQFFRCFTWIFFALFLLLCLLILFEFLSVFFTSIQYFILAGISRIIYGFGRKKYSFFFFCLIYTHFYIFPLRMFGYRSVRVCLCDFILRSVQLNFRKVVLPTIPPLYPQIHIGKGFPWNQGKLVQFFSVYTHKSVQQTAKNPARLHRTCWAWLEAFLAWMGEVRLNLAW